MRRVVAKLRSSSSSQCNLIYIYIITNIHCRHQPHFSRLANWEGIEKVPFTLYNTYLLLLIIKLRHAVIEIFYDAGVFNPITQL